MTTSIISRDYLDEQRWSDEAEAQYAAAPAFNISSRKVGGLRFVKIGRFCFSFCITKTYKGF